MLGLDEERAKDLPYIASMGIYVISRDAMLQLLRTEFPEANDFGSEVIPGATEKGMKVGEAVPLFDSSGIYGWSFGAYFCRSC